MSKFQKFWQLSTQEKNLFLQACGLLPLAAIALHWFGLNTVLRGLQKITSAQPSQESQPGSSHTFAQVQSTTYLVEVAAQNGIYRANCLQRSLVLWWLLYQQRINSNLRIGVSKAENTLLAHAWVEYQGNILNDRPDVGQTYKPFARPVVQELN